jgi:excisionase family DNA binding protein
MVMSTNIAGFVSVPEAAAIIGVTDSLVRRWVRNGTLPSRIVGGRFRVLPRRAVERFSKIERKPGRRKS